MPRSQLLVLVALAAAMLIGLRSPARASPPEESLSLAKCSMQVEMGNAETLVREGKYAEATEKCLWLWDHMLEEQPSMYGVRLSFFVSDLQRLTTAYKPAMDAFVEKRDALDLSVQTGNPEVHQLMDWFALNEAVHDEQHSVAWVLSLDDRPNGAKLFALAGHRAETILLDNDHYELYAKLCPDIVADARKEIRQMEDSIEHFKKSPDAQLMLDSIKPILLNKIAQRYLVCLKINEPLLAEQIAQDLFEVFDDEATRLSLIRAAMDAEVSIPEHLEWIDSLEETSPLAKWQRGKVEEQLKEREEAVAEQ